MTHLDKLKAKKCYCIKHDKYPIICGNCTIIKQTCKAIGKDVDELGRCKHELDGMKLDKEGLWLLYPELKQLLGVKYE